MAWKMKRNGREIEEKETSHNDVDDDEEEIDGK